MPLPFSTKWGKYNHRKKQSDLQKHIALDDIFFRAVVNLEQNKRMMNNGLVFDQQKQHDKKRK